jgi:hypothetical protein
MQFHDILKLLFVRIDEITPLKSEARYEVNLGEASSLLLSNSRKNQYKDN